MRMHIYYGANGNRYDKQQWNHDHSKYLRLMVINWNWTGRIVIAHCAENVRIEFMTKRGTKMKKLLVHTILSFLRSLSLSPVVSFFLSFYYVWDAIRCYCYYYYLLIRLHIGTGFIYIGRWHIKLNINCIYSTRSCIIHFYKLDIAAQNTVVLRFKLNIFFFRGHKIARQYSLCISSQTTSSS